MILEVRREQGDNGTQTISRFVVVNYSNSEVLHGFMLELPDRDNAFSISRINPGVYTCIKRNSAKYGDHFHVLDVEDRDYILIHAGNFYYNTRGCLLPGDSLADINNDGFRDVLNSQRTMDKLNDMLPNQFQLVVVDESLI